MNFNDRWYEVIKTKEDRECLEAEAKTLTAKELAKKFNVSESKIRIVLRMYDIKPKKPMKEVSIKEKIKKPAKISKEEHEILFWARTYNKGRLRYVYYDMLKRCYKSTDKGYARYGAKGITVCDEWKNKCFNFYKWAKENGYKEGLTIDRIDNNKGYSPDNCRWTTRKVQAVNRSCTRWIVFNEQKHTLKEWAEITGISYQVLADRIYRYGWTVDKALTTKIDSK